MTKVYYFQVLEIAWHTWGHTEKSWGLGREGLGSAFWGVEDGGP